MSSLRDVAAARLNGCALPVRVFAERPFLLDGGRGRPETLFELFLEFRSRVDEADALPTPSIPTAVSSRYFDRPKQYIYIKLSFSLNVCRRSFDQLYFRSSTARAPIARDWAHLRFRSHLFLPWLSELLFCPRRNRALATAAAAALRSEDLVVWSTDWVVKDGFSAEEGSQQGCENSF